MDIIKNWKQTFVCLHPSLNNSQLTKDPGMFAYILGRDFDYEGTIVCYSNGDYPDLQDSVKGLKILFMKKHFLYPILKSIPDRLIFIWNNAKSIDVLQLFQFSLPSLISGALYKWLNPKGVCYIKLDKDSEYVQTHDIGIKEFILFSKICHYDIVSIESREGLKLLQENTALAKYKDDFHYIPNGVDVKKLRNIEWNYNDKENLIICSGNRCKQKAVEVAEEAFRRVKDKHPGWHFELLGNLSKQDYFKKLKRAKIFMSPSRWEGFGIMQLEAAYFGNVIVGSNLTAMRQITDYERCGSLCPIDDIECFAKWLDFYMTNEDLLMAQSEGSVDHVKNHFDWHRICAYLDWEIRGKAYKPI